MTKLSLKSHGRVIPSCYTKEEFEIMRRMNMIQVEHLSKVYGKGENEVVALNDVSLQSSDQAVPVNRHFCIFSAVWTVQRKEKFISTVSMCINRKKTS